MLITLTPAQAAELTNTFWDITYTVTLPDNSTLDAVYSDDLPQELPVGVLVGIAAEVDTNADGIPEAYACAHPALTAEDEVLIKHVLDWRATQMATIAALPQAERAAARAALRQQIRTDGRQNARQAARVAARRTDRQEARRLYRADVRAEAVAAGKLPA